MSAEEFVDQDDGVCTEAADSERAIDEAVVRNTRDEEAAHESSSDDEDTQQIDEPVPTANEAAKATRVLMAYLEATHEVAEHYPSVSSLLLQLFSIDKALIAMRQRSSVQTRITRYFVSQ